tara:strand:+ start:355 stop:1458 length:1104 start_codon:yes stop_codon:yes gene_type:complete
MKTIPVISILLFLLQHSVMAEQQLYLAVGGEQRIDVYDIDSSTGELTKAHSLALDVNPGAMCFSPNHKMVYAFLNHAEKPTVVSLKRKKDGSLTIAGNATITSRPPYIRTNADGTVLLTAHYGVGDVNTFRIEKGIVTSEHLDNKVTEKTAHCIEIEWSGKFAYIPHTAPNKVYQFALNSRTGKLTPLDPPYVDGPETGKHFHAPRHIAFHPSKRIAYTSNEFGGGISCYEVNKDGTLQLVQTLSSLPPGIEGEWASADIKITPDGQFVYVSNRDVTARNEKREGADTLAGFRIDGETGRVSLVGYFKTEGFPRTFTIDTTGNFIYAGGQLTGKLAAYKINQETGELTRFHTYDVGDNPIWVMTTDK